MESSSSSSEIIGGNEDLVTQILFRLSVEPLLRFKFVSKQWLSLISTPHFSSLHALHHPLRSLTGLFLRTSPSHCKFLSLSPSYSSPVSLDFFDGMKVLQSCNGLLLCSTFPRSGQKRTYYITNPTTRQVLTLPSLIGDDANAPTTVSGMSLAFDPFNLKSCKYKVICVRPVPNIIHHYQIQVYQSETGAWRQSGSPFAAPYDMVFDSGVFWNGGIHWISASGNAIYFDVKRECICSMPKAPISENLGKKRVRYFGESDGHLYLIEIYGLRTTRFDVLEMEKDYSVWRVMYPVDIENVVKAFPEMVRKYTDSGNSTYYAFSVICMAREEESCLLLLHIPGKIISYDVKKKIWKKVCDLAYSCSSGERKNKESVEFGSVDAYQCVKALASV